MQLRRTFHPRFPFGSVSLILNLAAYNNSPDRSTKSTTSHLDVLCVLVNTEFQVLFHSPPGVLFTFPSQYFFSIGHWVVFRLGGWSPFFNADSSCPHLLWILLASTRFHLHDSHILRFTFPRDSVSSSLASRSPYPYSISTLGLASSAFARHYSRNLV